MDTAKAQIPKANKTGYKEVTVKHCSFKKVMRNYQGMCEIQLPLKTKGWTLIQVLCAVLTATTTQECRELNVEYVEKSHH